MTTIFGTPGFLQRIGGLLRRVWGTLPDGADLTDMARPKALQAGRGIGSIALVGAGPGARDLLTLRAADRLRTADVIFYDRLSGEDVLDLAGPQARRVYVGKVVGAHAWPQDRINAMIVSEALRGHRVVRLKAGDPSVFGRAAEELEAARAEGIPVEIVPGVTAACAAAAVAGRSLTERGVADTLVFATGMGRAGDPLPETTRLCAPGVTTAFYMSVRQSSRIATDLMARGMPADAPVTVAVDVSKPGQAVFDSTLGGLSDLVARERIGGCAILLVTWPEARARAKAQSATAAA